MRIAICVALAVAALFEAVMTLMLMFMPVKPGYDPPEVIAAVESARSWTTPMGLLAVLTVAAFFVVARQWQRMAGYEKLIAVVAAVVPLVLLRVLFVVAGAFLLVCLAIVVILGVVGLFAASGGLATAFNGPAGRRPVKLVDQYGNRVGSVDKATGEATGDDGRHIGTLDRFGVLRDEYGNRIGSEE